MYTRANARASTPLSCHPFTQVPPLKSGYLSLPSCAFSLLGLPFPPLRLPFLPSVSSIPSGPVHCCTTAMESCGRHVEKSGLRGACGCPKPPLRCPKPRESQKNRFFLKKSGENICLFQKAVVILHRFSAHEDLFRVERFF